MALVEVDDATLEGGATDVRAGLARLGGAVEYLAGRAEFDLLYVLVQDSLFLHHRNLAKFLSGRPPDAKDRHPRTDLAAPTSG